MFVNEIFIRTEFCFAMATLLRPSLFLFLFFSEQTIKDLFFDWFLGCFFVVFSLGGVNSQSIKFHLYLDFTNFKWSDKTFHLCNALGAMCRESFLTCLACRDTKLQFLRSLRKPPWLSLVNAVLGGRTVTTHFSSLSQNATGVRTHDLQHTKEPLQT